MWNNIKNKIMIVYDLFRYDIPRFIYNIWFFRKELYGFYHFDSLYNIGLFRRSLESTVKSIENGIEEEVSRNKKVKAINRAIEIMRNVENESYLELAEKELNHKIDLELEKAASGDWIFKSLDHELDSKVFKLSHEIELKEWLELWEIIKGTEYNTNEIRPYEEYDGSNLKRWWD